MDIEQIFESKGEMTRKQRQLADYITNYPEEVSYMTLNEFSREMHISEVTILKFCRYIGVENFLGLKHSLQEYNKNIIQRSSSSPLFTKSSASIKFPDREAITRTSNDDVANLTKMINGIKPEKLQRAAIGVMEARTVYVFAHDGTFLFAEYLAYRLRFFRLDVETVNLSINVQTLRTLRLIGKKDVAVLLTFPPYYDSVKKMLDHFESRNIPVITITNNESSPAVTPYTMSFICPTLSRYYYNSQVATVSFVNLLAACIAEEMGPNFDRILKEERETSDFLINWFSDSNE